jgi:hypothetical protein
MARHAPREVAEGTPVTLYAILEARPWRAGETKLYGTIERAELAAGDVRDVEPWSKWWLAPEFLWLKVEPTISFANSDFDPTFTVDQVGFSDSYQVAWGFGWSHAADIRPTADDYPRWDTGTMRFGARVVLRDHRDRILQQVVSASAEAVHAAANAEQPHRVTVRGGEDAFGHLLAFGGLPYVQMVGEVAEEEHPTRRFIGGTVLDFWIAGLRAAGRWPGDFVPWEALADSAEIVVDDMYLASDETYYYTDDPLRPVTWDEVAPGDVVSIDDHVGVLLEDRGPGGGGDGLLNRWDRILEAYFEPLRETAMGEAFVADIRVYRLAAADHDGRP